MKRKAAGLLISAVVLSFGSLAATDRNESKVPAPLKIHPKVFNLIDCWVSDSARPVVTEVNLDAVDQDGNEFNDDGVVRDGEWTKAPGEGSGFLRFRVLSANGTRYKVEYQENGGGSLTTSSVIEFSIEKRQIRKEGKVVTFRALRVLSIAAK